MLEKTPESFLGSKEIKPISLKGDQPWILTGRTDDEAEAPVFWSSDANRWFIGKVPDAGKEGSNHCITEAMNMNFGRLQETMRDREAWRATVHGVTRVRHDWAHAHTHTHTHPHSICYHRFGLVASRWEVNSSKVIRNPHLAPPTPVPSAWPHSG